MRRIAQRLREHDWFAAGIELLIVVVGILIALQVSNWNQERIDAKHGHAYLERIVADIDADLASNAHHAQVMAQVRHYGEQAMAHADTGALAEGLAWKTVLAYFQGGQFNAYSRESTAFEEMRDAGDLGLIEDPKLRSGLAFYYASNSKRIGDVMVMNLIPQYRQDIRSVTPTAVQDYIWLHCYRTEGYSDDQMIDCPSPIDDAEARTILANYARHPELADDLRFWLSTQRIAALAFPTDRRELLNLKALAERELRR